MIKKILFLALAVTLLSPLPALAKGYIGASIGNSWQSATLDEEDIIDGISEISENSTGFKFFGGFKSDGVFGLEGGYRDLGKISSEDGTINFEANTQGWDIEAVLHLELWILDLFGKAGAFFWSTEVGAFGAVEDESGTAFLWGLGAGVSFGSLGVRLEYEAMDVEHYSNLSMLSLGATIGF